MFRAHLEDGSVITGDNCAWNDVPRAVDVVKLSAGDDSIQGFDAYGFQKYVVTSVQGPDSGKNIAFGFQLIGIDKKAGTVVRLDVNNDTQKRTVTYEDLKDLTYNRELLRSGKR